jgi:uncharacterized iron-regulated protein
VRGVLRALLLLSALPGLAIASDRGFEPKGGWRSTLLRDHPLVGAQWESAPLSSEALADFRCPGFLLIGETHDNPDHHVLQAMLADECARLRKSRAMVFEQIRADQAEAVETFQRSGSRDPAVLLYVLGWEESGWPEAELYEPIFRAAIEGGYEILPGDAARGRVRAVARGGLSMLDTAERERLRLDTPIDERLQAALDTEIKDSHCGLLPESAIGGMRIAQRYRDAHLADAMLKASREHDTVVLIAGNGHAREDRGVPLHLRLQGADTTITTVLMIEVEEGKTVPEDYVPRSPDGKPAADWIIFTPRVARPDPCEEMRKHMGGG